MAPGVCWTRGIFSHRRGAQWGMVKGGCGVARAAIGLEDRCTPFKERMRNTAKEQCARSDVPAHRHGSSSPSTGMTRLSEGQAILLVLLLSLGLWAAIWGIFLAAKYGLALALGLKQ